VIARLHLSDGAEPDPEETTARARAADFF